MSPVFRALLGACLVILVALGPARAADPALSVLSRDGRSSVYSLAELDAMPQAEVRTRTIWTDGVVEFTGVALADILARAGAEGTTLRLTALNDYSVEMPLPGAADRFPIVATRMNGAEMPVRDKGPFWLVYPYDAAPEFRTETVYSRSVWQLRQLSVVE